MIPLLVGASPLGSSLEKGASPLCQLGNKQESIKNEERKKDSH